MTASALLHPPPLHHQHLLPLDPEKYFLTILHSRPLLEDRKMAPLLPRMTEMWTEAPFVVDSCVVFKVPSSLCFEKLMMMEMILGVGYPFDDQIVMTHLPGTQTLKVLTSEPA